MSSIVRRSFLFGSFAIVAVLAGSSLESTGLAAPKPGATTAAELVSRLGVAVDTGDGATIPSCFDTSVPNGRTFPDYLVSIAALNRGRIAVLHKADSYGVAVRTKVEQVLERWSVPSYEHGLGSTEYVKEGSVIYPPGSKIEMVIVKKRGVFLFDGSKVFAEADEALKKSEANYVRIGAYWSRAAASAVSADDLLAKLAKLKNE